MIDRHVELRSTVQYILLRKHFWRREEYRREKFVVMIHLVIKASAWSWLFLLFLSVPCSQGFQRATRRKHHRVAARSEPTLVDGKVSCFAVIKSKDVTTTTASSKTIQAIDKDILEDTTINNDLSPISSSDFEEPNSTSAPPDGYLPMMALCWGIAFLSALDRVAMSVAIVPMSQDFALTETVKGEISSILSIGYGLGIIPCGILVAFLSPRAIMAVGLSMWSLATLLTPLAANTLLVNAAPLLMVRAAMGAAESVVLPTVQRLIINWVPSPNQKSLAIASVYSGFQFGTVTAYLLSPTVLDMTGGWRGLFYVYGAAGVALLVPWLLFAQDSPTSGICKEEETIAIAPSADIDDTNKQGVKQTLSAAQVTRSKDIIQDATNVLKSIPLRQFAKSKAVWAMVLAHAANNWGLYNSLSWTPTFYAELYGLNVRDSALLSVLPGIVGVCGGFFAGSTADKILARTDGSEQSRTLIRKVYQGIALFGPAVCLGTLSQHIPEQPWAAQALLTGTLGLQAFNAAGYGAAGQEKAGERWSGLLYSITSLPGVLVGSIGVYTTGQILDMTDQDWSVVFGVTAMINILGATAFAVLYASKKEFE